MNTHLQCHLIMDVCKMFKAYIDGSFHFYLKFSYEWMAFLITFLGILSSINIGVIFRFVFFSVRYLSFFVRLRNLACDIFGILLFLIHLLFSQSFSSLQLWNSACKILGLVLFLFDVLCAISLCGLWLWNLACEILVVLLFLFHLLCAKSFCCFRLRNLACEILGLVLFL